MSSFNTYNYLIVYLFIDKKYFLLYDLNYKLKYWLEE